MLTVSAGYLIVLKAFPRPSKYSLFAKGLPTDPPLGVVKSVTELSRLFKIDLAAYNTTDLEIVLHFVNKERDPCKFPTIKRFVVVNDTATKDFLRKFEHLVSISSSFYHK